MRFMLQCEMLTVEKASMASGLEDKDSQIGRMQEDQASLQAQVTRCQDQVAKLQADLLQVDVIPFRSRQACASR